MSINTHRSLSGGYAQYSLGSEKQMAADAQITKKALKRLRQRREELGLSQASVASHVKVNASYIGLLERGERAPSMDVLLAMCRAVSLTPAELFADARPPPVKELPEVTQIRALIRKWPGQDRRAVVRVVKEMAKLRS